MILNLIRNIFKPVLNFRRQKPIDKASIKRQWQEIESLMRLTGASHFEKAIIRGDKLVNHIMDLRGARGETFADRVRDFRKEFSDYSGLWQAHILRNKIVHEPEFEVYKFMADKAIKNFKRALEDLRVL